MSRIEKLMAMFNSNPKDFTWDELLVILRHHGFEEQSGSGSRRRFLHSDGRSIHLHEPHPQKIVKSYVIKLVKQYLSNHPNE